jgi:hypothetical protein
MKQPLRPVQQNTDGSTSNQSLKPNNSSEEHYQSFENHHDPQEKEHLQKEPSKKESGIIQNQEMTQKPDQTPNLEGGHLSHFNGSYREPPQHHYQNFQQHHHLPHHSYGQAVLNRNMNSMRYGNYHQGAGGISPPPIPYAGHHHQYHHGGYPPAGNPAYNAHHMPYGMQHHPDHHPYQNEPVPPPPNPKFQLPPYARRGSFNPSPETTSDVQAISRSPSPPPVPPAALEQGETLASIQSAPVEGNSEPTVSSESIDHIKKSGPLEERGNNVSDSSSKKTSPGKSKEDATADAASILLQLSSVMKKDETAENETAGPAVQGSASMDDVSEATHLDGAPDLTSEPSSDSIDHPPKQISKYSDFPCAVPDRYPTRLALPYDASKLNSLHCFLRSELLEIFVVEKSKNKSPTHSPHSSIGRVGLRCAHCFMARRGRGDRDEAPMAVFYPKSIAEIYRLVTSWQRCHLRKCRNLPPSVRSQWQDLRETDKSRGKTHYWVSSAKEIGLMDCQSRAGGIRFAPDFDPNTLPPQSRLVSSVNYVQAETSSEEGKKVSVEANGPHSKNFPYDMDSTEHPSARTESPEQEKPTPEKNSDLPMEENSGKTAAAEQENLAPRKNSDQLNDSMEESPEIHCGVENNEV